MKKIIFILFLLPTLLYSQSNEKYKEFNFGVILIDVFENSNSNDGLFSDDFQLYPGASFLLGKSQATKIFFFNLACLYSIDLFYFLVL